jgi:hypothetical protein
MHPIILADILKGFPDALIKDILVLNFCGVRYFLHTDTEMCA